MSAAPDYYKILKIDRSAEPNDIRKAYRHLSLKVLLHTNFKSHPERSNDPEAVKVFTMLAEAYDVLSDCKILRKFIL
jgi:DnaJ-class molecular chaperone